MEKELVKIFYLLLGGLGAAIVKGLAEDYFKSRNRIKTHKSALYLWHNLAKTIIEENSESLKNTPWIGLHNALENSDYHMVISYDDFAIHQFEKISQDLGHFPKPVIDKIIPLVQSERMARAILVDIERVKEMPPLTPRQKQGLLHQLKEQTLNSRNAAIDLKHILEGYI